MPERAMHEGKEAAVSEPRKETRERVRILKGGRFYSPDERVILDLAQRVEQLTELIGNCADCRDVLARADAERGGKGGDRG